MVTDRQELTFIKCLKYAGHQLAAVKYVILLKSHVARALSFTDEHTEFTDENLAWGLMVNDRKGSKIGILSLLTQLAVCLLLEFFNLRHLNNQHKTELSEIFCYVFKLYSLRLQYKFWLRHHVGSVGNGPNCSAWS